MEIQFCGCICSFSFLTDVVVCNVVATHLHDLVCPTFLVFAHLFAMLEPEYYLAPLKKRPKLF